MILDFSNPLFGGPGSPLFGIIYDWSAFGGIAPPPTTAGGDDRIVVGTIGSQVNTLNANLGGMF